MRRTMKLKLLFVALLLCCFAHGAKAQNYGSWNGLTREEPPLKDKTTIRIQNEAQLAYARDHWNDEVNGSYLHYYDINYSLEADLDLSAESWLSLGRDRDHQTYAGTFGGNVGPVSESPYVYKP